MFPTYEIEQMVKMFNPWQISGVCSLVLCSALQFEHSCLVYLRETQDIEESEESGWSYKCTWIRKDTSEFEVRKILLYYTRVFCLFKWLRGIHVPQTNCEKRRLFRFWRAKLGGRDELARHSSTCKGEEEGSCWKTEMNHTTWVLNHNIETLKCSVIKWFTNNHHDYIFVFASYVFTKNLMDVG